MRELSTIQERENLNKVFAADESCKSGANHEYDIYPAQCFNKETEPYIVIQLQNGAKKLPDSQYGVLDTDLLEIVRDRLMDFQNVEFAACENDVVPTHRKNAGLRLTKGTKCYII